MKKYILIVVNERKIFEPDYFETLNEAQAEMIKRVEQIVEESGGKDCVEFEIDDGEAYVTDASFDKGDGNWDFVIVDEAHEGTTTSLGEDVLNAIIKPNSKMLALSLSLIHI